MQSRQESYFKRAYALAYFIHPNPRIALDLATTAMNKLEAAANSQFKRLYYTPTGRAAEGSRGEARRTKVALEEPHLLQRLIYVASEALEKEQEQPSSGAMLRKEDMVIRFVKHLIKNTLKRNSFYVNLGVSRLLHCYSTGETMDFYNVIVQDPERVRDDFYYRSRKRKLMKEFLARFGEMLRVATGARGEQRFEELEEPGPLRQVVHAALARFAPWDVDFRLPERFDPHGAELAGLAFDQNDPDAEHGIELNRMASVLLPDNYASLADNLGFASPDERLTAPRFYQVADDDVDDDDRRQDRFDPPPPSDSQLDEAFSRLRGQRRKRKYAAVAAISIKADGAEIARLDPLEAERVSFEIEEGVELLEAYAADDTLLATLLVADDLLWERGEPQRGQIIAEGGQEIRFELTPRPGLDEDNRRAEASVAYRETAPARAASLWLRRAGRRLGGLLSPAALRPAVGGLALAALAAAILIFWPSAESELRLQKLNESERIALRAGALPGMPLEAVRTVHVETLGSSAFDRALRAALVRELEAGARFRVVAERATADVVIKDLSRFESESQDAHKVLALAVVNVEGEILWRAEKRWSKEPGDDAAELAARIAEGLIADAGPKP